MLKVYRKISDVETEACEISNKNAVYPSMIMGTDEVRIPVVVDDILDIKEGDYIYHDGIIYTLNRDAEYTIESDVKYSYDLTFEHPYYVFLNKLYCNKITGYTTFTLTGKLVDFVNLLVWCINKTTENPDGVDTGWMAGSIIDTDYKNLTFTDLDCKAVLTKLADDFGVEFFFNNKQVNFVERIERITSFVFEQGKGKGLYKLTQQNVDREDTITRLLIRGGNQNVPNAYADEEGYLKLPQNYLENFTEHSKVVEKKVKFEEEFPRFIGTAYAVSDTNNKVITCPQIDFDLAAIAVGDNARINFLSGDLMGISFKFDWDNANKKITLIEQEDETALADNTGAKPNVPNATKKAKAGDTFNFTGVLMPTPYVTASINRLRDKGAQKLAFFSRKRVKFSLDIDHRYLRGKDELKIGDLVVISIPKKSFYQTIRITGLEKNLYTGAISATVSNYLEENWEKYVKKRVDEVTNQIVVKNGKDGQDGQNVYSVQLSQYSHIFQESKLNRGIVDSNIQIPVEIYAMLGNDRVDIPPSAITVSNLPFGLSVVKETNKITLKTGDSTTGYLSTSAAYVITITIADKTFNLNFSHSIAWIGQDGNDGTPAKLLYLSASANVMSFDKDNNPKPTSQTITLEAKLQNATGTPTFSAIPYNGTTALTAITLGGSGATRTLTQIQWPSNADKVVITATSGSLTDVITIVKIKEGADGQSSLAGHLTNENITLPASYDGVVSSANLATAKGNFILYYGLTDVTANAAFSVVSQTNCTVSINSSGAYSVTAIAADSASAVLRATYNGVTYDKILTLSKSRAGKDGNDASIDPELLSDINKSIAITDKFGTTVDGALINTVMMILREANTNIETSGISGLQGQNLEYPSFWSGGTYAQALALINYLLKMSQGITPEAGEYDNLANVAILHNGAAKIGAFLIEANGRIILADPATGKPRLIFSVLDIPSVSDLVNNNFGSGSVTNVSRSSIETGYALPNTISVTKENSSISFIASSLSFNASFPEMMDYARITVYLRKDGATYSIIKTATLYGPGYKSDTSQINYSISGLPTGVYSVYISIEKSTGTQSTSAYISSSTLSWSFTPASVRYFQFGKNGFMAFFTDNHIHFTETGGFDVRGLTNMPGVLLSATVNIAGGFLSYWGAKKHTSSTAVKNSTGSYTVYHSVGHTNYQVVITPRSNKTFYVSSKTSSSFTVYFYTNASTPSLSDTSFDFQITGNNYSA